MDRIPIILKSWAQRGRHDFEAASRSLTSLLGSHLPPGSAVIVLSDATTDPRLQPFLAGLARTDRRVRGVHDETDLGLNAGQEAAFERIVAEYPDAPFFVEAQDDVVYHPSWLERLIQTKDALDGLGLAAILTAIDTPARKTHGRLVTPAGECLLQWRQPAANWLVPRAVHRTLGPCRGEGIAPDLAFCHWARLRGISVACLRPSLVHRIGFEGASAIDRYSSALAPIRWGSEWVHEAEPSGGRAMAVFRLDDSVPLGWKLDEAYLRAESIRGAQRPGPMAIAAVGRAKNGEPTTVECRWTCLPNLREIRRLWPSEVKNPMDVVCEVLAQLEPIHAKGIVHNKVRVDNVYRDRRTGLVTLAWFGIEPRSGRRLLGDDDGTVLLLSSALDARATRALRESHATRWLETVAPEVIDGEPATPASDVFAAAATALRGSGEELLTLSGLRARRRQWEARVFPELWAGLGAESEAFLSRCLDPNPARRFRDAKEALKSLEHSAVMAFAAL